MLSSSRRRFSVVLFRVTLRRRPSRSQQAYAAPRYLRDDAGRRPLSLRHHRHRRAHGVRVHGLECDGYSLNMRMVTQMTDSQGQTNMTDLRSSTWEQGNGQKFRFQSAQYLNDKLERRHHGACDARAPNRRSRSNSASRASRAQPVWQGAVPDPAQPRFDECGDRGKGLFQAQIYDGSEKGQKVYETTAFIGGR